MTTSGDAHFKLQLGNSEWSYPFIVAQLGMTTKAILGNNLLRDQESNIDIKLGVLSQECLEVPCKIPGKLFGDCNQVELLQTEPIL